MSYKGPENPKLKLTEILDPKLLVDLSADVLFSLGCTNTKKMDGPGDGGRDLYAEDQSGQKLLVQCKFHNSSELVCGSRELSELPMALMKFNYKKGIFITNAKISPQAKREYLDNYQNFNLNFIDGDILCSIILDNPLLRSIWFDGKSFISKLLTVNLPILIREHENDLPYIINDHAEEKDVAELLINLKTSLNHFKFSIKKTLLDTRTFEPYKAPLPLTCEEGATSLFSFSSITVEGLNTLVEINDLTHKLSIILSEWLQQRLSSFTIRFGKPHIINRPNTQDGSKLELNIQPISFVKTKLFFGTELDFIEANNSVNWSSINDARVTEAEHIRIFNKEFNVCIDHSIISRIEWNEQLRKLAIIEQKKLHWEQSIFCLIDEFDVWPYKNIPEPDEQAPWISDNQMICGWLHHSLLGYLSMPRQRNNESLNHVLKIPSESEWLEKRSLILYETSNIDGINIITPHIARHMVSIIGSDPFEFPEQVKFICGEITSYPETIPSPILPCSRLFLLEFIVKAENVSEAEIKIIQDNIFSIDQVDDIKIERNKSLFIFKVIPNIDELECKTTSNILDEIFLIVKLIMNILNSHIKNKFDVITDKYWLENYNVSLGIDWHQSTKQYFGLLNNITEPVTFDELKKIISP
ncbi:restriction endonuclease [Shewanella sp. ANA-3]|uniref:restriction endonuclease n=1 Tax=Shewanella sp. (strain ANA-3) TaxID=94122 RepID=UPI00005DFD9E|nr:restriction endonuclease [Shewanella sp. ANA-3]ABK48134.1 restriction endonuclease [Shewanella sp. ANA-3]